MGFFFGFLGPRYAPALVGQAIFGGLQSVSNAGNASKIENKIAENGSVFGGSSEESLLGLVVMVLTISLGTKGHRQDTQASKMC